MNKVSRATPLFLREAEIRKGFDLLFLGHSHFTRALDSHLATRGLGRAHHRVLYFVARSNQVPVGRLLSLLSVTKQSFGRVLNDIVDRGLVEISIGEHDRRNRILRLTPEGAELEIRLFETARQQMSSAYLATGQDAVSGFWSVLEGLIDEPERRRLAEFASSPNTSPVGAFR